MTLENEKKTGTIHSINTPLSFNNIPHKHLNKPIHIKFSCPDYLDLDTTVNLTKAITLGISRNPSIYGDVHFLLWNSQRGMPMADTEIIVDGHSTISDENGQVSLSIPINEQKRQYHVEAAFPLEKEVIIMPCGEDDAILTK